jgi:hypothetical protein
MKFTDPYDGKTLYESVRAAVRKYTLLIGADVAAAAIDLIGARPDLATPHSVITVTGTGAKQVVAHGMRNQAALGELQLRHPNGRAGHDRSAALSLDHISADGDFARLPSKKAG